MQRRVAISKAQCSITDAMMGHELTALEWLHVFHTSSQRMIGEGLKEEWNEEDQGNQ
jgi:hypothetical protein